jgi:DGQHR domain-containing protein
MPKKKIDKPLEEISVILPKNPFTPEEVADSSYCLCAIDVEDLMRWWPGEPHQPQIHALKVRAIQRSLDWKRVAEIAAYLMQKEITEVPEKLVKYFEPIYEPKKDNLGRQWPPKVKRVIKPVSSAYPTFSNVLIHINGALLADVEQPGNGRDEQSKIGKLTFDTRNKNLDFSVIDGQHRINGAYFALCLLKEEKPDAKWSIPAEIFLDLDKRGSTKYQAGIFIDVNFYQKKVDRSLVADLFPTSRGARPALDNKERAQDIGRRLMLETGPLVGMIQIPGIRYGVKDVITLATLNSAIERELQILEDNEIDTLELQTDFFSQCISAWLEASGRFEDTSTQRGNLEIGPQNVVFQGRVLVSIITLMPAMIAEIKENDLQFFSEEAREHLVKWLKKIARRAGLLKNNVFIPKDEFKEMGFLGSGGIGRFRDLLWAATHSNKNLQELDDDEIMEIAEANKAKVNKTLTQTGK